MASLSSSNSSSTSWDNLPEEIIIIIRDNLTLVIDCIRFGAICKAWRFVYLEAKKQCKRTNEHDKVLPLSIHIVENSDHNIELFVTSFQENGEKCTRNLCFNFMSYCGTSYGWIAFQGRANFFLYNPFLRRSVAVGNQSLGKGQRVAFSTRVDGGRRVAFLVGVSSLFMYNFRDQDRTVYLSIPSILDDIVIYKGKLFVVNWRGKLWVHDSHYRGVKVVVEKLSDDTKLVSAMYLVESSKGELLLVPRCYDLNQSTKEVKVYKLLMKEKKWEEIHNLNDNEALFIGGNQGVCILLSPFMDDNIQPNCIYFTRDFSRPFDKFYDSGFYSLSSRRIVITEVGKTEDIDRRYGAFLHGIGSDHCWLTKLLPDIQ